MKRNTIILMIMVTLSPALLADTITGTVTRVIDGDTLVLSSAPLRLCVRSPLFKVRLADIDAPEMKQAYGPEARRALSELVLSNRVTVTWIRTDRYGRIIGTVRPADGRPDSANRELVRRGCAWQYLRYSRDPALTEIQRGARAARLGLWASDGAMPPWEFRRERKERQTPGNLRRPERTCING